jgi:hypothetical protein
MADVDPDITALLVAARDGDPKAKDALFPPSTATSSASRWQTFAVAT